MVNTVMSSYLTQLNILRQFMNLGRLSTSKYGCSLITLDRQILVLVWIMQQLMIRPYVDVTQEQQ